MPKTWTRLKNYKQRGSEQAYLIFLADLNEKKVTTNLPYKIN